jgi:PAS domain S-box-containing protein
MWSSNDISEGGQQEERLQALIDSSPLALVEFGLDTRIRLWNPAAERIFGWSRDEMLGRGGLPMAPPSKRAESEELFARVRAGESVNDYETVRQRKDGALVAVSIAAAPVRDGSGRVVSNRGMAGQREEDVVERRAVDRKRGDRAALGVDLVEQGAHVRRAAVRRDAERQAPLVAVDDALGEQAGDAFVGPGVGERQVQARAGDALLELRGGALGDDAAAVDDRDAIGEPVGLLEVLRREEHRHAAASPALHAVLDAGVFDHADPPDDEFAFGLERILDGIETLVRVRAQAQARPGRPA